MKKRFRVLIAAMCVLALAVTPAFAAWGDTSSGEMTATGEVIKDVEDGETVIGKKIDTFKLDDRYTYKSLTPDPGKTTLTMSKSNLQNIVRDTLLPQWSGVAASIFRDQAGQLVDLYGYEDNGDRMSQAGFDAYFNMGPSKNETYKDEVWSCYHLNHKLGQASPSHAGDPGWDQFTVSGIKQISSLNDARNMVGQALYDCQGHKGLKPEEFIGVTENGNTRLGELESDAATTGFVNLVTAVNCKGSSSDFDYVQFGIVFYDFEAVPVAANGLSYIHGKFMTAVSPKANNESVISNGQQQDIVHSAVLGDSVTETTSTTISAMASAKASENIGANVGWKETQSGSDTEFDFGEDGFSSSSSGWSEETSMGLSWGAAWELAGAAGAEVGHSQSKEISKAAQTTIALPAHTAATINHEMTTTTYSQTYQQPVILNYKVALFAVSGDYYTGGDGGINPPSYEKQSLVIKLDTKGESSPTYGCAATDDLYSRVITNKQVANYDVADGRTYETHSSVSGWTKSEDINWDSVIAVAKNYYGADVVGNVAKTNYIFEMLGKLNVDKDKTTSTVESMYPLYGLSSVKTPKTNYVMFLGNELDRTALSVQGYNRFDVPFYGFNSEWGEWNRCDENGTIVNGGLLFESDPAEVTDQGTIKAKADGNGGTIYLTWVIEDQNAKPKTAESPDGQNLAASNISCPVVRIDVVNAGLDDPSITAEGSWTGFYGNSVNLNNVMEYEVTDNTDKILETQVKWESREPSSSGIFVNAGTGNVTFTQPGTFHVRPYVINNSDKKVYSDWLTVTAAEHDMTHYAVQTPTCTADGCVEHYKCADCGKYFSDADGKNEIPAADVIIEATGHDWGEWTTTKQISGDTPGEQRRVCKNDASHVETRALYTVQFNMNGHGTAPETQAVASGTSMTVPEEPTAAGYTFGGWFTDESCTTSYNFGTTVEDNLTLYAKWSPAKYMVAAVAVGDVYKDEAGEQKVYPVAQGSIEIDGGSLVTDEDGYTYSYKEVESGTSITLKVKPYENYGLKNIKAATVNAKAETGDPFDPVKTDETTYSLKVSDADVAVVASFGQVTVTYDGNAPAGAKAYNVPKPQAIACGGTPKKTLDPSASGENGEAYLFKGWYTDSECTKAYDNEPLSKDTTLFAKWEQTDENLHTITYTLFDVARANPASYEVSYKVAAGSTAYDPTDELYAIAGEDVKYGYELKKVGGASWFTDKGCTEAYNFESTVTDDVHLYAQIVPKQFNVSFFDGESLTAFAIAPFDYNTAIGDLPVTAPTKTGYTLSGWTTQDGKDWDLAETPVVGNMYLYAKWTAIPYAVVFTPNAPNDAQIAGMPDSKQVDYGSAVEEPNEPSDETGKYKFDGWYKDAGYTNAWNFKTDTVKEDTQLFAKWTVNSYTVSFDMQGHGTAIEKQTITHGKKATSPEAPSEQGYDFGGWFISKDGGTTLSTEVFNFDTPITADTTLYAKWTKHPYNVTVEPLSNGVITPSSTTATQGATVTLKVAPEKNFGLQSITVTPKEAGSTAITPVKVSDNTYTFTMPYSDVKVGATFGQVTVTFNENAPSGATVANAPAAQTIGYGGVPAQPNPVPAVTGGTTPYTFVGWCLDQDCTKPYLFTPLKENNTLYAKWIQDGNNHNITYTLYDVPGSNPASYSVTDTVTDNATAYNPTADLLELIPDNPGCSLYADASGNTWFTDADCKQPYDFSGKVTSDIQLYAKIIPNSFVVSFYREKVANVVQGFVEAKSMNYGTAIGNSAPKLTKEGYTFTGWKDAETDSDWNLTTAITNAVKLYAAWTANTYTVTFAANAPSGVKVTVEGMPDKQTIVYGEGVQKAVQPEQPPTAIGYTFGGWFSDVACTEQYNFDNKVDRDLTLFAKWEIENFEVAFDANGAGTGPNTQIVSYGNQATDPGALTLAGYTFGGWCTSTDGGTTLSETPFDFSTPITENTDLYAEWTIDVTFDANGHGTAPEKQSVASGSKVEVPQEPTATGYAFGGWFTDKACTIAYDFKNEKVTQPLTLYAKWTANEYTVTFNANGHGTAPAAQTVKHDEKASEPAALTADGFTFGGWFTDAACTKAYDFGSAVEGNLTLYAKWTAEASDEPEPAPVVESQEMYRIYNPNSGEHFYTASAGERDGLVKAGWNYEGVGWLAPVTSSTPVFRLYSGTDHHYTTSEEERGWLIGQGWKYEGIGWYSDDAKGTPLYRQFNPNVVPTASFNNSGSHNYTTSKAENDTLVSLGWQAEGIGWYGLAASVSGSEKASAQNLVAGSI